MTTEAVQRLAGERRERVRTALREVGFDAVKFAAVAPSAGTGLRGWLQQGMHAEMGWMERTVEKRVDANLVLPGARTIILLGINYWQEAMTGRPTWARYALYEDYHDTVKVGLAAAGRRLEAELGIGADDYRYYVDTGPVLERGWAARSGLGFRGKNAMLISPEYGNWLFLACILTRAEIAPDEPLLPNRTRVEGEEPAGLLCGKCRRCLEACPTDAFAAPGVVDARRCISYQTIENKGIIPRELRAGIGERIYGCDVCLEVCPWNRFARDGRQLLLAARRDVAELGLREILEMTPARFAEVFRRTPIKRLKLIGLLRNACIVAGNRGDRELLGPLARLAAHESAMVRAHAVWAVRQLAGPASDELLSAVRAREQDPQVLDEYSAATV